MAVEAQLRLGRNPPDEGLGPWQAGMRQAGLPSRPGTVVTIGLLAMEPTGRLQLGL